MKTKSHYLFIVLALFAGVLPAIAQLPIINSFSQNGVLVCSGLQTGTVASVQWASSLSGPWQTNWASLAAVTVSSNGTISASVPMFYRVLGVSATTNNPATNFNGMALIPVGTFTMGDTLDVDNLYASPTNVYVAAFYMDTNLVSYSQWQSVYSYATSHGYAFDDVGSAQTNNQSVQPVQTVNWYDVVKWSNARSQQKGLTPVYYTDAGLTQVYTNGDTDNVYVNWSGNGYRLPTEAEWEKAARGGLSGKRFPWGNTISESQANYYANPGSYPTYDLGPYSGYNTNFNSHTRAMPYTSPVGSFAPNGYGLYDMAGNVEEWCWDWFGQSYGQPTTTNPTGPASATGVRVMRGGLWEGDASGARCAHRAGQSPNYIYSGDVGFRCVRGL